MDTTKPLRRSRTNRMIGGVVGGLAEHLGMDPALARLLYVAISVFSAAFPGILVYIVMLVVIPEELAPPGLTSGGHAGYPDPFRTSARSAGPSSSTARR